MEQIKTWAVGDKCIVSLDDFQPAVISKIGRRWVTATLEGVGRAYEFDKNTGRVRGTVYGCTPRLLTEEQVERIRIRTEARKAVLSLEDFVQRCDDPALLKEIAAMVTDWVSR